jgi:methylmalonyl-CoA mutase, N-terminal domain
VGINDYTLGEEVKIPTLYVNYAGERAHLERLERVRRALAELQRAREGPENTMPALIEVVRAYTTLGEIMDVFRSVFGEYMEPAVF